MGSRQAVALIAVLPAREGARRRRDPRSLLQKNILDRRRWDTREELRIAIITWIERTYHRRRRQVSLGRLTPIEFEAIMTNRTESGTRWLAQASSMRPA